MKTSYEQFKEDLNDTFDGEMFFMIIGSVAIFFWYITLIVLAISLPIYLIAKMVHNAKTTAHKRELERKRKLGYDC